MREFAMKGRMRRLSVLFGVAVFAAGAGFFYLRVTGLDARGQPYPWEARMARAARSLAISETQRARVNPVPRSEAAVVAGMEHFADHCASCHANDGSGNTEMGRNLWPKTPDMRAAPTQQLTDGELFSIIERGVRFTGMPAWSTGTAAGEESSWRLVHFIRHLSQLTPTQLARMQELNPRSPEQIRQESGAGLS
jgi:mono/diheme cytochrome c family protein